MIKSLKIVEVAGENLMLFVTGKKKLDVGSQGIQTFDSYLCIYRYDEYSTLLIKGDSSVGTAKCYGLDDRRIGVGFLVMAGVLLLFHRYQSDSGAHLILISNEYRGSFPWSKAAGI
jgi:hypothetical protein